MQVKGRACCLLALTAILAAALVSGTRCLAQEVASIDLTQVEARTDFRRPAPRSPEEASGPRNGSRVQYSCDRRKPDAASVRTTLVWLDRSRYRVGDRQKFEVTIENTGSAPIQLPFSPHLTDLQPRDPGEKFAYSSMAVTVWISGARWSANTGASVTLYGAGNHPGTMLVLDPGEWVRVVGEGTLLLPRDGFIPWDEVRKANAGLALDENETLVTATESATVSHEVCLNQSQGPSLALGIAGPDSEPAALPH